MRRIRKSLLSHRYLVTLENGEGFSGLLYSMDNEFIMLDDVTAFTRDGQTKVDHRLIIERAKTLYLQEVR